MAWLEYEVLSKSVNVPEGTNTQNNLWLYTLFRTRVLSLAFQRTRTPSLFISHHFLLQFLFGSQSQSHSLVSDWLGKMHVHFKDYKDIAILQERRTSGQSWMEETEIDVERGEGRMGRWRCGAGASDETQHVSVELQCVQKLVPAAERLNVDGAPGRHHSHELREINKDEFSNSLSLHSGSRLGFKVRAENREMMQNPHLSHDSRKALLSLAYLCFLDKSPRLSLWTPCACMSLTCVSAVVCFGSSFLSSCCPRVWLLTLPVWSFRRSIHYLPIKSFI